MFFCFFYVIIKYKPPSSSGLGHQPLTLVTRVRTSLGVPKRHIGKVCYTYLKEKQVETKTKQLPNDEQTISSMNQSSDLSNIDSKIMAEKRTKNGEKVILLRSKIKSTQILNTILLIELFITFQMNQVL